MNVQEMASILAERTGAPAKGVRQVIEGVFDIIGDTVAAGGVVRIRNFGKFFSRKRKARAGRNPRTGETMTIAETPSMRFTAGKELKIKVRHDV